MKKVFVFLPVFSLLFFISCKKDSTSTTPDTVTGTWKFVSLNANTESTVQYTDGIVYKTVTTSGYTTINNGGTVSFTGTLANGTGITYSIDDSLVAYDYEDGVLVDTLALPFTYTLPATSSTTSYALVGTDSIYFSGGGFISPAGTSGTTPGTNGAKFVITGNIMTLTSHASKDTTINDSGTIETHNDKVTAITTLQKQ